MNKVIIHFDPTITVHELDHAMRSIGCRISVGRNRQLSIGKPGAQASGEPPEAGDANAIRDELAGADSTLLDLPSFLQRQGE